MSDFGSAYAGMLFTFVTSNNTHTSMCDPASVPPGGHQSSQEMLESSQPAVIKAKLQVRGVFFPNWNNPTHQMKRHQQMNWSVCTEGPNNLLAWSGGMKWRMKT